MNYQWYPGHMSKARRQMQEDIKLIDVVIELVDARIPFSSKNPDIDQLAKGKSRIILLNKHDMADPKQNEAWKRYYEEQGYFTALVNSKANSGVKEVTGVIQEACKEKIERNKRRGILNRPMRAMIVGIPNVGKSTFINSFAGKACTKTGNKPGVTKGKQWIKLSREVELLDTPGILWPKFEDQKIGMRIAWIGSINEDLLRSEEMFLALSDYVHLHYPGSMTERYGIEETENAEENLRKIAEKRGCLLKGGVLDLEKASKFFVDDIRNMRLGRISLEWKGELIDAEKNIGDQEGITGSSSSKS